MNWEKFNHRLRKDAEGQNNDVDIDSIWGAIEPQVDEINIGKKKKRRVIFFWWGAGVLLLSVGLWFLGNQFSPKENIALHIDNQEITSEIKTNTVGNKENFDVKNSTTQQGDLEKNNDITNTESKSKFSKNKNQVTKKKSNLNPPSSTNSNIVLESKIPPAVLSSIAKPGKNDEGSTFRNPEAQENQSRNKEEIFTISSLINLLDFASEKFSLAEVEKVGEPYHIEYPEGEGKGNRFSIGIYGGANYTHRTLAEKREVPSTLLSNRETYETPLETSQVGVNFSFKILNKEKYNLEITTGLQLTSIAERYKNYSTTAETVGDVFGVQYLSYGLGNDPVEIMGWISQTKTTEYKKEIFNTYRMIDIPVLIGYNRSFGKKWEMGIQGGIFANLSLQTEGIIPNSSLSDVDLESDEFNIFKSNVGLSYHLGFSIRRELTKHWELNFSPAVRYFGNDFANDNYGLSQKYMLFGGNVGVRYKF